jgi:hypothetical protein
VYAYAASAAAAAAVPPVRCWCWCWCWCWCCWCCWCCCWSAAAAARTELRLPERNELRTCRLRRRGVRHLRLSSTTQHGERERGVRHLRLSSTTQHGERESTGWAHTEVDTPLPSSHPRFNQVLPSDAFIKGLWVPSSRLSSSRSRPKRAHSLSSAPWRRRTPPTHEQTIHQPPSALLVVSSDKPIDD